MKDLHKHCILVVDDIPANIDILSAIRRPSFTMPESRRSNGQD
jgi:hypothetical protein